MGKILFQTLMAGVACTAFSVLYNAPKKELLYCGLAGCLSWFVYAVFINFITPAKATFIGAAAVTAYARFASYHRQAPSTMYHIPGIMPLVPGTTIYAVTATALNGAILETYSDILLVLKLAGAIGAGSILILAMPYSLFEIIPRRGKT